ncbi:E3 SUMO-protein ligase ZBED1-like [Xyrichtys novacula]|uniref:E3 SUMO-protein ligase ZBED1-like n=1 Tax=Xyrichtys novacula TaxID=13765 RepID=A0AAV1GLV5_XYRNO|nr:E3 SUMO-protein ligase ZBED1-like [Xyrichtys novacula]
MEEKEIQPAPSSLKAQVWHQFGILPKPGHTEPDMTHTVCRHCKTRIKHFGNTTNAQAHITRHHPEMRDTERTQPPAADQRTLQSFSKLSASSKRAKTITGSIANCL